MPSRSFQTVRCVHDCVSPSAPEREVAVEGACSEALAQKERSEVYGIKCLVWLKKTL